MHWILIRIADGLHLGFGLPIRGPNPPEGYIGTCKVFVESHEPLEQQIALHASP